MITLEQAKVLSKRAGRVYGQMTHAAREGRWKASDRLASQYIRLLDKICDYKRQRRQDGIER